MSKSMTDPSWDWLWRWGAPQPYSWLFMGGKLPPTLETVYLKTEEKAIGFLSENTQELVDHGVLFAGEYEGLYPWRYFDPSVTIPIQFIARMLRSEYGISVRNAEIIDLMQHGILPCATGATLPFSAKDKIVFVKECQKRFQYRDSQLKHIFEYEDNLIKDLSKTAVWNASYDECNCLNRVSWKTRMGGVHSDGLCEAARDSSRAPSDEHLLEHAVTGLLDRFKMLKQEWSGPLDDKWDKRRWLAEHHVSLTEQMKYESMLIFRENILRGHPPQICFRSPGYLPKGTARENVRRGRSSANVEKPLFDFVRTPTFTVEHDDEEIIIRIPRTTGLSQVLRKAETFATAFGKKLATGRAKRGTASEQAQRNEAQRAERNAWLKQRNDELKAAKPLLSAERRFELLREELLQEAEWENRIRSIEISTIKRIVYRGS